MLFVNLPSKVLPLVVLLLVERIAELFYIPGMGVETRPQSAVSGATAVIVFGGFLVSTVIAIVGLVAAKSRPRLTAYCAVVVSAVFFVTLANDLFSHGGGGGPPGGVLALDALVGAVVVLLLFFAVRMLRAEPSAAAVGPPPGPHGT